MTSQSCAIVTGSLEPIVGDILAKGIIKTGLQKVGATPDSTTPQDMKRAIDAHIRDAVKAFMGREKACIWAAKMKDELDRMNHSGGA